MNSSSAISLLLLYAATSLSTRRSASVREDRPVCCSAGGAVAATIQEIVGQYRCDIGVPRGDGFDATHDFAAGAVFEHVTAYVQVQGGVEKAFVLVHGQEDHGHIQLRFSDLAGDHEAVFLRHIDVEDSHLRATAPDEIQRALTILSLRHNLQARIGFDDLP